MKEIPPMSEHHDIERRTCPKRGCGAIRQHPCSDGDCPQQWMSYKEHAAILASAREEGARDMRERAGLIAHDNGQYSMAYVEDEPPASVVTHNRACWAIRDAIRALPTIKEG